MKLNKIVALLLAVTMLLTTAACGQSGKDLSWTAKLGDQTIAAGVYVLNVVAGLNAASMAVDPTQEGFLEADIDGKKVAQFVADFAKDETMRQLATDKKFKELGLTLTEEEKQNYEGYAKEMYASEKELYQANGISEQSMVEYNRDSIQAYKVFQALYTGEGEKAATTQEMKDYFAETYHLAYVVPYLKVDEMTGAPLDEAKLAEVSTKVNTDLAAVKDGSMTMADLVYRELYQSDDAAQGTDRGEDVNYMMPIEKVGGMWPAVLTEHLAAATVGEISLIEDETYKLIVQKSDEKAVGDELATLYYESLLPSLKQTEFSDLCTQWG